MVSDSLMHLGEMPGDAGRSCRWLGVYGSRDYLGYICGKRKWKPAELLAKDNFSFSHSLTLSLSHSGQTFAYGRLAKKPRI